MKRKLENRHEDYTLGLINKAFLYINISIYSLHKLYNELPETLSMLQCETLLRQISLYINKSNYLNEGIKSKLSALATVAFNQLDNLLSEAPKSLEGYHSWLLDCLQTNDLEKTSLFYSIIVAKLLIKKLIRPLCLPII